MDFTPDYSNGEKSGYVWSLYDEETDTGSIVASMAQEGGYGEPVTLYEKKGVIIRYSSPALDTEGNRSFLVNAMRTKELCAAKTAVITANGRKQLQMTVNKTDITYNQNDAAYLTLKAVVKDGDYNEDNNISYVILYKEKQKTDITKGTKLKTVKVKR